MFIKIHKFAIELEKNRNEAIKESLLVFINILQNFFGEEKAKMFRESHELLLNINLDDFAKDSFDLYQLLTKEDIDFIQKRSNSNEFELTINNIH